ncbi:hypothetical protein [Parasphingorhabdus sp.]|uniref:hypothetical protein n=1 Tax=Parasphingorhabdus sp. TaxID=2709688 RepID=UPI0039E339F9
MSALFDSDYTAGMQQAAGPPEPGIFESEAGGMVLVAFGLIVAISLLAVLFMMKGVHKIGDVGSQDNPKNMEQPDPKDADWSLLLIFVGIAISVASIVLMDGYRSTGIFESVLAGATILATDIEVRWPLLIGISVSLYGFFLHFRK